MKVQADNFNGVYEVEDFDGDVISQEMFYAHLASNPANSVLCAEIDDEMSVKIDSEYGICYIPKTTNQRRAK